MLVVLPSVLLAATALGFPAASSTDGQPPDIDFGWHPGQFVEADVPVYPAAVDSWACHFLNQCRTTEDRSRDDAAAIWTSSRSGERVEIECQFGAYYKIHQSVMGNREREGWALRSEVSTFYRLSNCPLFAW